MAGFDVEGARKAGYSDAEIQGYQKALDAGYKPEEIDAHLSGAPDSSDTDSFKAMMLGGAKALGSGVAKGVADFPGGVIQLGNLLRKVDPLNLPGMNKEQVPVPSALSKLSAAADNLYTPQNDIESGLKTAGEYAPAVMGGPEAVLGKGVLGAVKVLAGRAVKQAALPGAAAAGANAAAEGTPYQDYAGPLAAMATGGLTVRGKAPSVEASAAKATTNASYNAARNAGVTYDPSIVSQAAAATKASLSRRGIGPLSAGSEHETLDALINNKAPMSLTDLEEMRQELTSSSGKPGEAAKAVKKSIDAVMSNPAYALTGNAAGAYAALQQGRTQALAGARISALDKVLAKSQQASSTNGTELNKALKTRIGNKIAPDFGGSTKFADLFKSDPELMAGLQGIAGGSFPQAAAHRLGGGDLSKWRMPELLALVHGLPIIGPVIAARLGGLGLSKITDARSLGKLAMLRQLVAQKGNIPYAPGGTSLPTQALIGAVNARQ